MSDVLFNQENRDVPPEQEGARGPRRLLVIVAVAMAVVLVGLLGAGIWINGKINPGGGLGEEIALTIPEGATTADIAELLAEEGVVTDADIFRYYVQFSGGASFQAGEYTVARNSAMGDVVAILDEGPEIAFDEITVPEGLSLEEVADRVGEEIERFSAERFMEVAESGSVRSKFQPDDVDSLEGFLFPETYRFDQTEDEEALLKRMVDLFDTVATEVGYDEADIPGGLTPYEAIIVASLIESEARVPEDRAKISRVIYNRIEEEMLLQIDATVIYARGGEHRPNGQVLYSDLEVDSPYNTYKYSGLPPTPIAMPGRASLEAALDPDPGDWLFYVKYEEDGTHAFAETGAEHSRLVAEAKARGVNP